ncbi:MAG: hypothetical protein K2Y02_11310 [Burkholderiaceae bacterium]|nr:hypothetical protein [Burkholderiaceae bacterium]
MPLHSYSVNDALNSAERTQVYYKVAAAASVAVGGCAALLAWLTRQWGVTTALAAPATVVVYLFLVRLIELHLWKWKSVRFLLGITLPDINGRWNGKVETRTRDGKHIAGNTGVMCIAQTWSTIGVEFETNRTSSYSTGAFLTQGAGHLLLTIEYQVELVSPHKDDDDVQSHKGTSKARIPLRGKECDLREFDVSYYTDHRETGTIHLTRA